jgi:hypothetical protein
VNTKSTDRFLERKEYLQDSNSAWKKFEGNPEGSGAWKGLFEPPARIYSDKENLNACPMSSNLERMRLKGSFVESEDSCNVCEIEDCDIPSTGHHQAVKTTPFPNIVLQVQSALSLSISRHIWTR